MKKRILVALSSVAFLIMTACGGGGYELPPTAATLSPQDLDLLTQTKQHLIAAQGNCAPMVTGVATAIGQGGTQQTVLPQIQQVMHGPHAGGYTQSINQAAYAFSRIHITNHLPGQTPMMAANDPAWRRWFGGQLAPAFYPAMQTLQQQGISPQSVLNSPYTAQATQSFLQQAFPSGSPVGNEELVRFGAPLVGGSGPLPQYASTGFAPVAPIQQSGAFPQVYGGGVLPQYIGAPAAQGGLSSIPIYRARAKR